MLYLEQLEPRNVMSVLIPPPTYWQAEFDTNKNNVIEPADALQIINHINESKNYLYDDTNQDGFVSPIDALLVIQFLNNIPSHTITIRILDADSVGFTEEQFVAGIRQGVKDYTDIADVNFVFVDANTHSDIAISTYELYSGNLIHARGWYGGNGNIGMHSGIIQPWHHSGRNGPVNQIFYYQMYSNIDAIAQIFGHEVGHYLGMNHSSNTNCRMHSNAPPGFCQAEKDYIFRLFGEAKG